MPRASPDVPAIQQAAPAASNPQFQTVVLTTGSANGYNVGDSILVDRKLYVQADSYSKAMGHEIVAFTDKRSRTEQPRVYIRVAKV